jgi:hypothetical protein
MAKKETFRKVEKDNRGKVSAKVGKYYQIGDNHSLKADKALRIETAYEVTEHDKIDTLPAKLKDKQAKHEGNKV